MHHNCIKRMVSRWNFSSSSSSFSALWIFSFSLNVKCWSTQKGGSKKHLKAPLWWHDDDNLKVKHSQKREIPSSWKDARYFHLLFNSPAMMMTIRDYLRALARRAAKLRRGVSIKEIWKEKKTRVREKRAEWIHHRHQHQQPSGSKSWAVLKVAGEEKRWRGDPLMGEKWKSLVIIFCWYFIALFLLLCVRIRA